MIDLLKDYKENKPIANWFAGKAEVMIFKDRDNMANSSALQVAKEIKELSKKKSSIRMIFAAAPSQTEFLNYLTAITDVPWNQVTAFQMDDYIGLPADAPQRFSNWLEYHLFSKVPFGSINRISTLGSPEQICVEYAKKLSKASIDIVCLGIGVNGHLAFNDPPYANFKDPVSVKVVRLDDVCRKQQVDDQCFKSISEVPEKAVTLTIPRLLSGASLFCNVPGESKRKALRATLQDPISTACPASILRTHGKVKIFLDREAYLDE
jgi:glucosamine-6-phosphate deaminase